MKTLSLVAALFAVAAPFTSFAAEAPADQYHYGQQLDIKKVLSLTEGAGNCQVVPAHMKYLDSNGQTHTLTYQKFSSTCNEGA